MGHRYAHSIPKDVRETHPLIAQTIVDSIATLASLRPRSSAEDGAPLVPSPAVLRKLHRSLALEPSPGWYGNLPASRATALHDDSTIKVKSPTATPAVPPAPAPSTAPVPTSQAPATPAYPGYTYNYSATQQQQYRPAAATYAPYKGQQAGAYYQYSVPATEQQSYYGQQSYASSSNQQPYGSGGTGQQTYQYGTWYNQYQPPVAATSSKPGTPVASTAPATSYNTFFAGTNCTAAPRPAAVGNTVANKAAPQAAAPTWPAQTTYQATSTAPTLPSHLRTSQSSTPQPNTTAYQQQAGYYQAYQMQTSATPSR